MMENKTLKQVEIYADGATRNNPGKSGWGAILLYYLNGKEY
ncbi:MAG: ribonuclease HI, partial [Blastocatellia bacterium]|nr:ribonuclease HI [Blastocatellia bacterium]